MSLNCASGGCCVGRGWDLLLADSGTDGTCLLVGPLGHEACLGPVNDSVLLQPGRLRAAPHAQGLFSLPTTSTYTDSVSG